MRHLFTFFLLLSFNTLLFSQKLITREGLIKFEGETPLEKIDAVSDQAASVLSLDTRELVFRVLVKSFVFPKALMQEHFNENYAESDTYPNAIFKGKIVEDIDFSTPGTYDVSIKGSMTFHGVEREIETPAQIIVKKSSVSLSSRFTMAPEDYGIKIPSAVRDKIAREMMVIVRSTYNK
jgi:polyisoprenoid-binding protein YceI